MRRRKYYKTNKIYKRRGRGLPQIYKTHKKGLEQFQNFLHTFYKTSETFLDFNGEKKYVLFINRKKSKRKNKKIYETKRGKGFGDRFKLLYSLGKQWRNSVQ